MRSGRPAGRRTASSANQSEAVPRGGRRRLYVLLAVLGLLVAVLVAVRAAMRDGQLREQLRRGMVLVDEGRYAEAAPLLDRYLRAYPEHLETLLYRGQIARELGDVAAAREFWQRVPDESGRPGGVARYLEATLLMEAGQGQAAEAMFLRSAELNPEYLQPHERLLEIYVAQMRRAEVRRELEAIRRLRPWSLEELVLSVTVSQRIISIDEGIKRMQQFVAADPRDVTSAMALAHYFLDGDRLADAARLLEERLAGDATLSQVRGLLAQVYLRQGDEGRMATVLRGVVFSPMLDVWFWRSCGRYWADRGDHGKAVECYRRVLEADPEDLPTCHRLGTSLARVGREQEAQAYLQRATLIDRLLRQAIRVTQRKDENHALRLPIVLDIASLLLDLGRLPESVNWYEQALSMDANSEAARNGFALAIQRRAAVQGISGGASDSLPEFRTPLPVDKETLASLLPPPSEKLTARLVDDSAPGPGGIVLRDRHEQAGLDHQYFNGETGLKYLLESMGGGVAVLDYDNDGWPDLFFPQGCTFPFDPRNRTHRDRLYRNSGRGTFEDVTESAGLGDTRYSQGCSAADYDNDGDPDLVVANYGENLFYRNNGDGTFTEISHEIGLAGEAWSSSVALADLDRDGNLDLYVVNYVDSLKVCRNPEGKYAVCDPANFNGEPDVLYHSRGDGTFEDISEAAGILQPQGNGLGVLVADLDDDGWPDVYVANDTTPNFLFHNLRSTDSPRFASCGMLAGAAVSGDGEALGSMGIACADFDANGLLDLCVTNFYGEASSLYFNRGKLIFEDGTRFGRLFVPTKGLVGFGVQAVDFDLDGRQDLFMANGHIDDFSYRNEPWKMSPKLFRGLGDGRFSDLSDAMDEYFQGKYLGRGAARLDWDRDGDPDLVVVHQDRPLALLTNETPATGGVLVLECHGVVSNREAIGVKIRIVSGERRQVIEVCGGDGFYAANERRQFVGLGGAVSADTVEIRWPSGRQETLRDVSANSRIVVVEGHPPLVTPLERSSS